MQLITGAQAVTIQLDYSYDAAGGNFFGTHAAAKQSLEAAAAELGTLLPSPLGAVTQSSFAGTSGPVTVTIDWTLTLPNPSTGAAATLSPFTLPADTVRILVGMRPLQGSLLAKGVPATATPSFNSSGSGTAADRNAAQDLAQAASNSALGRGAGATVGGVAGSFYKAYDLQYGVLAGSLWFDDDVNNDGIGDDGAPLAAYWNFDSSAAPGAAQNDFYSVALQQMVRALGFGNSRTWDQLHSGTTWLGNYGIAAHGGSGQNLVTTDGMLNGQATGTTLEDGTAQLALLDTGSFTGTRREMTTLDAALLRDLGYVPVPEPEVAGTLTPGLLALGWCRRRRRGGHRPSGAT